GVETEHFTGSAWMDREFGTWTPTENQKGWDWFSIQLDNDCELMVYQLRNSAGERSPFSSGSLCYRNGEHFAVTSDDFSITPTGSWKSPVSGAEYPSGWLVSVPEKKVSLKVVPVIDNQELDTRGTTMIVYWEGACDVTGDFGGESVSGNAYVELVGYDRSHDQPNLSRFLLGNSLDFLKKI
ncbi:MAG: lipocalin family protein, partial [Pyrinomonadaceae bacterium]